MSNADKNCKNCTKMVCEFNPQNEDIFCIDPDTGEKKVYDGIAIIHEFTQMKGCIDHSSHATELMLLKKEIQKGQQKYQEMIETAEDGTKYKLALKALDIVLTKIENLEK